MRDKCVLVVCYRERLNQPEEALDDKEALKQQLEEEDSGEEKAVEDSKV